MPTYTRKNTGKGPSVATADRSVGHGSPPSVWGSAGVKTPVQKEPGPSTPDTHPESVRPKGPPAANLAEGTADSPPPVWDAPNLNILVETREEFGEVKDILRELITKVDEYKKETTKELKTFTKSMSGRMEKVEREITNVRRDFNDQMRSLEDTLALDDAAIRSRLETVEEKLSGIETSHAENVRSAHGYIDSEMGRLVTRMEDVERKLSSAPEQQAVPATPPLQDTDRCVILQGLKHDNDEDLTYKVCGMLEAIGMEDIHVVDVARLPRRGDGANTKPGLVKVALRNKEQKIELLRAKQRLKDHGMYKKLFIRSSQTHQERVSIMNTKALLDIIPGGNSYWVSSHGKIIPKTTPTPTEASNNHA